MFHFPKHRPHHHRDRKDYSWYEVHASEILVEPETQRQIELLRFLSNDPHTFHRLKDTLTHRAYAVLDALERIEFEEPPTGTSYNHGHG